MPSAQRIDLEPPSESEVEYFWGFLGLKYMVNGRKQTKNRRIRVYPISIIQGTSQVTLNTSWYQFQPTRIDFSPQNHGFGPFLTRFPAETLSLKSNLCRVYIQSFKVHLSQQKRDSVTSNDICCLVCPFSWFLGSKRTQNVPFRGL